MLLRLKEHTGEPVYMVGRVIDKHTWKCGGVAISGADENNDSSLNGSFCFDADEKFLARLFDPQSSRYIVGENILEPDNIEVRLAKGRLPNSQTFELWFCLGERWSKVSTLSVPIESGLPDEIDALPSSEKNQFDWYLGLHRRSKTNGLTPALYSRVKWDSRLHKLKVYKLIAFLEMNFESIIFASIALFFLIAVFG